MVPLASQTISRELTPSASGGVPHLFLGLVCDRLSVPSIRICLRGVEELSIGRGDLNRAGERSARETRLALAIPAWSLRSVGLRSALPHSLAVCAARPLQ